MPRPSSTAATMEAKLSSVRTMSDACFVTSVPLRPMAMPMSAPLIAGCVVDAVAGHGHDGIVGLPGADDAQLVRSSDTGIHGDLRDALRQLVVGQRSSSPPDSATSSASRCRAPRNGERGVRMVAGDHHHADTRGATLGHCDPWLPRAAGHTCPPYRRIRARARRVGGQSSGNCEVQIAIGRPEHPQSTARHRGVLRGDPGGRRPSAGGLRSVYNCVQRRSSTSGAPLMNARK